MFTGWACLGGIPQLGLIRLKNGARLDGLREGKRWRKPTRGRRARVARKSMGG
jgi:hypothetical protein